jgi:hypothetical protein
MQGNLLGEANFVLSVALRIFVWCCSSRLGGVTTRKCANCPAREAAAMLARSAIRAETRFSRCPGSGEDGSVQKSFVSRSKSDNQAHAFHLATTPRCPPRCLPGAQSARIHPQHLKLSNLRSLEPDNSDTFVSSPPRGV